MVKMANNFDLGVDKDKIEELLELVAEEQTNEKLLGLEQEHIAKEETREKEPAGEEKEQESPRKFGVKGWFSRSKCRPQ